MRLRDGTLTPLTVAQRYDRLVETGAIARDPAQARVVKALDRLLEILAAKRIAHKSSALGWLFGKKAEVDAFKGLYIHGGVGRGKTMLMDMFHALAPITRKRRVHFNDFMAEIQDRIQKQRQARGEDAARQDDPIPPVAEAIAADAQLLCFDEFAVTDIADAMILSRLFSALFANGVVLVATSNVAPDDLYRDGLNRGLFLPFLEILKRHADIVAIESRIDHRLEKLERLPVYVTPLGPDADRLMNEAWETATQGKPAAPDHIALKGRVIAVPAACGSAARFTFADLCDRPLGGRDYLAIADRFATIFIDGIPILHESRRNEVKRLILLIDTLYDRGARLFVSAAAPPAELYGGRKGAEAFEFDRTASRLIEMQGTQWLKAWRERHAEPGTAAP